MVKNKNKSMLKIKRQGLFAFFALIVMSTSLFAGSSDEDLNLALFGGLIRDVDQATATARQNITYSYEQDYRNKIYPNSQDRYQDIYAYNGEYYRLQNELEKWRVKREELNYLILNASRDTRIKLIKHRAEMEIMQSEALLSIYKTILRKNRAISDIEVQKSLIKAETALLLARRKFDLLKNLISQEAVNQAVAMAYTALEFCAERPLPKDKARTGRAIDGLSIVVKNAQIYGPVCSNRLGHFLTPKQIEQIKFNLAFAAPEGDKTGKYFTPFLAIHPEFLESLEEVLDGVFRTKCKMALATLNHAIGDFYRLHANQFLQRQKRVGAILTDTLALKQLILHHDQSTHFTELEKLLSKINTYELERDALEFKLSQIDKYKNAPLFAELSIQLATVKNLIAQLSNRVIAAQFAHQNIVYYLDSFIQELQVMKALSQTSCQKLWIKEREKNIACGRMQHPNIEQIDSIHALVNASRVRLCPSRTLLDQYILNGPVYTFNFFCFGHEDVKEHVHFPVYNHLCSVYHALEGCAHSEHLKPVPNVANIFSQPILEDNN